MTRIIAGMLRGRRLHTPKGSATRPTSDRTREALFSALAARGVIEGARVLDLYAGSGALGIEAVSRGARAAILVDSDRGAVAAMRRSLSDLGLEQVSVRARDVRAYLQGTASEHDLVLVDPPYDLPEATLAGVLEALTVGWLAEDAVVVVERSARSPEPTWPPGLESVQDRRYGETAVWLAQARPPS
ncbi:MAG: 16S rRNA (guanine(966)-N(2))-methyltransferase RsmD [Dermatophilaceae bacterium]